MIKGDTTKEKAIHLLKHTGVATVPADAFYNDTKDLHLARFCFSKRDEVLDEACERLKKLL
jgi:aminotransferase